VGGEGKRLVLVNPVNPMRTGLAITPFLCVPPLSLGIIAALTPEPWRVQLIDENWEAFRCREADLVGITGFTASANRAYQIAATYRRRGTAVVMGGIHASTCPQEALQFVDAVVIGEAETVWADVLADAEGGRLRQVYRGEWPELAGWPRPRRDLFHPGYQFASVQTSRGCPMDCEFCSVPVFNGRRYRRRPPEEVLDELQTIPQRNILFVDDNIIGHGAKHYRDALELFRGMVRRGLRKRWLCQASLNFGQDEEVLRWAGRAGCKLVLLGLEAEEVNALAQTNKRLNLRLGVQSYTETFRRIHRAGIAVMGAFIFGFDGDTLEKIRRRADYIIHSAVDAVQASFLTPLPGTRLFERLEKEGRLLYTDFPKDWDRYDFSGVVHRPLTMEPDDFLRTTRQPICGMYSRPVLLRKAVRTLRDTRDLTATLLAWRSNISYRNVVLAESSFS